MKIFSELVNLNENSSQEIAENLQNYIMSDTFLTDDDKISHLKEYIEEITSYSVNSHENELILDRIKHNYRNRFEAPTVQRQTITSLQNDYKKKPLSEMTVKEILESLNI
jgi:hypothetical protein